MSIANIVENYFSKARTSLKRVRRTVKLKSNAVDAKRLIILKQNSQKTIKNGKILNKYLTYILLLRFIELVMWHVLEFQIKGGDGVKKLDVIGI